MSMWAPESDALRAESEAGQSPVWPEHGDDGDVDSEEGESFATPAVRDDFVISEGDHEGQMVSGHAPDSEGEAVSDDADHQAAGSRSVFDDASDTGEPTQAISGLDFAENTGDQFLDQLRRAVDDDASLDSDAMSEFFSAEVNEGPRSRFGRRR